METPGTIHSPYHTRANSPPHHSPSPSSPKPPTQSPSNLPNTHPPPLPPHPTHIHPSACDLGRQPERALPLPRHNAQRFPTPPCLPAFHHPPPNALYNALAYSCISRPGIGHHCRPERIHIDTSPRSSRHRTQHSDAQAREFRLWSPYDGYGAATRRPTPRAAKQGCGGRGKEETTFVERVAQLRL
jgi:hypothetical protein